MTNEYVTTRNDNGDLAIRTVSATGDNTPADNSSVVTRTDDGKLAVRIVGGTSGGDSLPSQSGNAGKFLTTNGTNASWANVPAGDSIDWVTSVDVPDDISGNVAVKYTMTGGVPDGEYEWYYQRKITTDFNNLTGYNTYKIKFVVSNNGESICGFGQPVINGEFNTIGFGGKILLHNEQAATFYKTIENGDFVICNSNYFQPWATFVDTDRADVFRCSAIKNIVTGDTYTLTGEIFDGNFSSLTYFGDCVWHPIMESPTIPQNHAGMNYSINNDDHYGFQGISEGEAIVYAYNDTVSNSFIARCLFCAGQLQSYQIIKATGTLANTLLKRLDNQVFFSLDQNVSGALYFEVGAYGTINDGVSFIYIDNAVFNTAQIVYPDQAGTVITVDNLGKIYQYFGETNAQYTNGYFYQATGTTVVSPATLTLTPSNTEFNATVASVSDLIALIVYRGFSPKYAEDLFKYSEYIDITYVAEEGQQPIITNVYFSGGFSSADSTTLACFTLTRSDTTVGVSGSERCSIVYTPAQTEIQNPAWIQVNVQPWLESVAGYDAAATQTLKNVNGVFTWVND